MSSRYFYSNRDDGRQEPGRRVSCKTFMTQALLQSRPGNRGVELAAGLAQVTGNTIEKALINEKEHSEGLDRLSREIPEKSERLKKADRVHKIANPILFIPIGLISAACGMVNILLGVAVFLAGVVPLALAGIWAINIRVNEGLSHDHLERARKELADAKLAKAELCAKTGLSEKFVELLQALPLKEGEKHTVLRQAIFQDSPEDYVVRVARILEGVDARRESLAEFAERRLEYLSRDISQARELEETAEKKASSGDNAAACALFVDAAKILEKALDYAGAAEMYRKASCASPGNGAKAAELSAKSAQCLAKAGATAG